MNIKRLNFVWIFFLGFIPLHSNVSGAGTFCDDQDAIPTACVIEGCFNVAQVVQCSGVQYNSDSYSITDSIDSEKCGGNFPGLECWSVLSKVCNSKTYYRFANCNQKLTCPAIREGLAKQVDVENCPV